MSASPQQGPPTAPRRQLVLCFDGTNNNLTGGKDDTNVVKLCRLLDAAPGQQLVYYDPGVGNPGNIPGVTLQDKVRGTLERAWGLAFGKGIYENLAEAYTFLLRNWQPTDAIYVFGFSRGAFTARSLAGMIARFGILRPSMEGMVPTLLHLYFADPPKDTPKEKQYKDIVAQLGTDFCTPEGAQARVWFVGVWDTVASVGSPFSRRRIHASGTIIGKRFDHVRQALALDEHRRSFEPRPYYIHPTHDYASTGQSIEQQWFSGAHCDVGGGYITEEAELSDSSFLWLLGEACGLGLRVRPRVWDGSKVDTAAVATLLRPSVPALNTRRPLVHSETFSNAYWALTGLGVRDSKKVRGNKGDPPAKPPVRHAPPAAPVLDMPPWPIGRLLLAAVAAYLFVLLHGAAVSGQTLLAGLDARSDVKDLWANARTLLDANAALAQWQLLWWRSGVDAVAQLPYPGMHAIWMVLVDGCLILCYGYIVAVFLARGFSKAAGLRGINDPPPRLLNALGWSGAAIVLADLAENGLMLLVMLAHWIGWGLVGDVLAAGMSLASACKWLAVVPALLLALRGFLPTAPRDAPPAIASATQA